MAPLRRSEASRDTMATGLAQTEPQVLITAGIPAGRAKAIRAGPVKGIPAVQVAAGLVADIPVPPEEAVDIPAVAVLLRVADIQAVAAEHLVAGKRYRTGRSGLCVRTALLLGARPIYYGKTTPMPYLLKSEPDQYSFEDLEKDKETVWDGVTNPTAVKHLREMKPHNKLIIYHTGTERQAVGTATVVTVDPTDAKKPIVRIKA